MEGDDDGKLRELLKEWQAPGAPKSLDERMLRLRQPWWRVLLTGSIRIPVPVGVALAVAFLTMAGAVWREGRAPEPVASSISLVEFRPVNDLHVRVIRNQ